jgi:hypothetical protein
MRGKRMWIYPTAVVLVVLMLLFFSLGLHRKPNWIRNFEEDEYGGERPFVEPAAVVDGLAVYRVGAEEPALLCPYTHGHTTEPMAQSSLADILVRMGRPDSWDSRTAVTLLSSKRRSFYIAFRRQIMLKR